MGMRLSKISGTLQEMSGEELARQQGLPAAPPTPLGAQGMGASQDVAKMAGTPNQVRAMVQDTLKERMRTKDLMQESERNGARKRFTVESLQERMNVLEGLGSLEGRIQTKMDEKIAKAQTEAVPNPVDRTAVAAHLASLGITKTEEIDKAIKALEKVKQSTATPGDITSALAALKIDGTITDSTTSLADKFSKFFTQADVGTIKNQMATTLKNFSEIKMKDLDDTVAQFVNQQNGVIDVPAILGISDDEFNNMTLGEVQAQLKAWKNRNFQDVEALRNVLQDPTYSMTEKDYARQRLAELGAIGVTSIEQKANNLEAQVAEGDTVVVGGQSVKVSEIMSDPKLKGVIATALESDEELAKLANVDKNLANWITNNKAALVPIRNELLAGAEKFASNNKAFVDQFGDDATTYSKLLDSLTPGWNKAKDVDWETWSSEVAKTSPTLITILKEPPSANRSVKLKVLESMSADQAKNFSTDSLTSIATAAGGDVTKAQQLTKAWLDSSTVSSATLDFSLPAVDATDFTEKDSTEIQTKIINALGKGYTQKTFTEFVTEMQRLAKGTPEDRLKAQQMYIDLGTIQSAAKSELSADAVGKFKVNKTVERIKKETVNSITPIKTTLDNLMQAIGTRGYDNWLKTQGRKRISPLLSELATLQGELTSKLAAGLEPEVMLKEASTIQEKIKAVNNKAGGELAAFLGDTNTTLDDSASAAELLSTTGLIDTLNDNQRKMIQTRLSNNVKEILMLMKMNPKFAFSYKQDLEKAQRVAGPFGGITAEVINLLREREKGITKIATKIPKVR